FLVFHDGKTWQLRQIGKREGHPLMVGKPGGFTLSRPLIVVDRADRAHVIYRDAGRRNGVTVATSHGPDYLDWSFTDILEESVGDWEPTCDINRWYREQVLDLLIQKCQVGYPRPVDPGPPPEPLWVLSWRPESR